MPISGVITSSRSIRGVIHNCCRLTGLWFTLWFKTQTFILSPGNNDRNGLFRRNGNGIHRTVHPAQMADLAVGRIDDHGFPCFRILTNHIGGTGLHAGTASDTSIYTLNWHDQLNFYPNLVALRVLRKMIQRIPYNYLPILVFYQHDSSCVLPVLCHYACNSICLSRMFAIDVEIEG